jgi:ubiquinone/menaquinone biosynthesis C-methylase UbiE
VRRRTPFNLRERLFAWYYPRLLGVAEDAGQRETRHQLIAPRAHGEVLELGAGFGVNLPHYGEQVEELIITEPSPYMLRRLQAGLADSPLRPQRVRLQRVDAQQMPFPDASFDTVVGTFILCTTPDPERVLAEVARVLRPGGRFLFMEHVHAGEKTMLGRLQDAVQLPHRILAGGCHPNRRTERLLENSPLRVVAIERDRQPRAFPTVRPVIRGEATVG